MAQSFFALIFLTQSVSLAAIYGADDRKDLFEVPEKRIHASAIAAVVPGNFMAQNKNGTWTIADVEKSEGSSSSYVCKEDRFSQQPTIGNCTAFLIGPRTVVTAGHCIMAWGTVEDDSHNPFCSSFKFYFDYSNSSVAMANDFEKARPLWTNIPAKKIYGCSRVIKAELSKTTDYAILELDREALGIIPLKIHSDLPQVGEPVYTLGHPAGLPLKDSGSSAVTSIDENNQFEASLDTTGGNSGGPVFNSQNEVLGILIEGHQFNFYQTPRGCYMTNRCNEDGTSCVENSAAGLKTRNVILSLKDLKLIP